MQPSSSIGIYIMKLDIQTGIQTAFIISLLLGLLSLLMGFAQFGQGTVFRFSANDGIVSCRAGA